MSFIFEAHNPRKSIKAVRPTFVHCHMTAPCTRSCYGNRHDVTVERLITSCRLQTCSVFVCLMLVIASENCVCAFFVSRAYYQ